MIFKNINSEDISGLIICSEPPISSSAIRTKETTIDGRDGAIVEKLGYKTRIRNVEIGLKKDANVDKILSYFSGEGDLIFKNENDKVYKAAIYEQVDLERLLRLRKGSVAFYCQPFKYKRNDIFETIKDNKVKEKKGEYLELLNCAEQNVVDLKLEGSTSQVTRSGKNLFNYKDAKVVTSGITVDEEGWITATYDNTNGTKNQYLNYFTTKSDKLSLVKDYKAFIEIKNVSGTGVLVLASDDSISQSSTRITYTFGNLSSGDVKANLFTTKSDFTNCSYMLRSFISFSAGQSGSITFRISVLEDTKITPENFVYEQYGESPSPDYPSEIENVEGKNKFNKSNMTEATWDNGKTNTVTLLEDGRIQSTANYAQWAAKCIDIPNLKANTNYVVSGKIVSSTAGNAMITVKGYKNNTLSNIIYRQYAVGTKFELSFNSSDYEKIGISLNGNNSTLETIYTTIFDEIQLEEGTIATSYVPYNSLEIKDIGENLFDKKTNTILTWLTAAEITEEGSVCSKNFIPTTKDKIYATNFAACVFYYDKKLNYLGNSMDLRTDGGNPYTTWTNPDNNNIAFMKVEYRKSFNNNLDMTTQEIMLTESETVKTYKPYQEQKLTFPLSEGQKLYEGSYLASDGIHHKRKQVVLDGTETVNFYPNATHTFRISIRPLSSSGICTHYKQIKATLFDTETGMFLVNSNSFIVSDPRFSTTEEFKAYLAQQYSAGTPVTFEYIMIESNLITSHEEIVPYTTAQQEAYNQLQKLKLYKGQNTMFSLEGSIINLKYLEDTDEKVENQGNIYSKPIIRLEKTVFKEVEIAINGIRFKYNFEEDDYVEIDCEQMTVQYEGLDRNRRLVIDFEFPKLKEGNNDIIMYDGDCIIKCKRKDRWL